GADPAGLAAYRPRRYRRRPALPPAGRSGRRAGGTRLAGPARRRPPPHRRTGTRPDGTDRPEVGAGRPGGDDLGGVRNRTRRTTLMSWVASSPCLRSPTWR